MSRSAELRAAIGRLAAAGVDSPRVDAELLLAHVLGQPRSRLLTTDALSDQELAAFAATVDRRARREPLQYITGTAPFRRLELAVGPGVFVPRPETELLIDAVLPKLSERARPIAVDLCAGSGALALALVDEISSAQVVAVERPGSAVPWLQRNTAGRRVEVVVADVADPELLLGLRGHVDAVVSNPPYVPASVAVAAEVEADPVEAVFAGTDGLAVIPHVIARAADLLAAGGVVAIEHDDTQGQRVPELLVVDGRWAEVVDHLDLAGRPRFVTAVRR